MTDKEPELWVPVARVQSIADRYTGTIGSLSESTQRKLSSFRNGQEFVSLSTVDKMLIDMGLEHWLRMPMEDGGLEDIYFGGAQYGSPDRGEQTPARLEVRENRRKYRSVEDRRAAELERMRRWYYRHRAEKVPVKCRTCGDERMVSKDWAPRAAESQCRACNAASVRALWAEHRAAA